MASNPSLRDQIAVAISQHAESCQEPGPCAACTQLDIQADAVLDLFRADIPAGTVLTQDLLLRAIAGRRLLQEELTEQATAFVPAERGSEWALYLHRCGNTEWWSEAVHGPINQQGCDACEAGPDQGWRPVYVRALPKP